jgi:hypothetical protein
MELQCTYPRKYNGIVLAEIQRLGFVCGDPIPLSMADKTPNGELTVSCHNDRKGSVADAFGELQVICAEPWFIKDDMVLRLDYEDGYLQYPALRLK